MKIRQENEQEAIIILTKEELEILHATLNEICNGIAVFEFETRIGAQRSAVIDLLQSTTYALDDWK